MVSLAGDALQFQSEHQQPFMSSGWRWREPEVWPIINVNSSSEQIPWVRLMNHTPQDRFWKDWKMMWEKNLGFMVPLPGRKLWLDLWELTKNYTQKIINIKAHYHTNLYYQPRQFFSSPENHSSQNFITRNQQRKAPFNPTHNSVKPSSGHNLPQPRVTLSNREMLEKRAKGLCFTCNEKWSPNYLCPNKELHVLIVLEDKEVSQEERGGTDSRGNWDIWAKGRYLSKFYDGHHQFTNNEAKRGNHWKQSDIDDRPRCN